LIRPGFAHHLLEEFNHFRCVPFSESQSGKDKVPLFIEQKLYRMAKDMISLVNTPVLIQQYLKSIPLAEEKRLHCSR
jgi:hypothetical protein